MKKALIPYDILYGEAKSLLGELMAYIETDVAKRDAELSPFFLL